jgi:hypothetical protein
VSPERRRIAVHHAREKGLSERRACRLVHDLDNRDALLPIPLRSSKGRARRDVSTSDRSILPNPPIPTSTASQTPEIWRASRRDILSVGLVLKSVRSNQSCRSARELSSKSLWFWKGEITRANASKTAPAVASLLEGFWRF